MGASALRESLKVKSKKAKKDIIQSEIISYVT